MDIHYIYILFCNLATLFTGEYDCIVWTADIALQPAVTTDSATDSARNSLLGFTPKAYFFIYFKL